MYDKENVKFESDYEKAIDELHDNLGTELSYFYHLFPKEIFEEIAFQSTLYSAQTQPERPVNVKANNIVDFVGCVLYMSIVKVPSTRDYWSSSIGIPHIAGIMPLNKFEQVKRLLHFADNNIADKEDKIFKIRPLIKKLNDRLHTIPIEESVAVDPSKVVIRSSSIIPKNHINGDSKYLC